MPSPTPQWRDSAQSSLKNAKRHCFVSLCLLLLSSTALAQPSRVVVVAPGEHLEHALTRSLGAWDIQIEAVPDTNPGPTMPGSSVEGQRIADHYDALAVVWVSESDRGFALWVFDARNDRILARPLPSGPPFDGPTAAQVALIVKTFLRSIPDLAPVATSSAVSPPTPPIDTSASVDLSESVAESRRTLGWDVLAGAGVRGYATTPSSPGFRLLLGVTVWPIALRRALGISLLAENGPGARTTGRLNARWTDSSLLIGVRGRLHLGSRFDLGVTFGVGVRFTTLQGNTSTNSEVAQWRVGPVGRLDLEMGVRLASWLRLELRGGTTLSGSVQRYFVGETLALDVNRFSAHALLGLEFRIR